MNTLSLHTNTWKNERVNALSLGYCFNAISIQDKPRLNQDTDDKG